MKNSSVSGGLNCRASYPNYLHRSGWNALLPARICAPSLRGDRRASVAVIGAGYTGIAAAERWAALMPDADIVMLDATTVGEGNSGRNSGFLLDIALANDADRSALQRIHVVNTLLAATMQRMVADVAASGVDCELRRTGTYRGAAGRAGRAALAAYRLFLEVTNLPHESLGRADIAERLGTHYYAEGLYSPNCFLAQPAALARALLSRLPESVQLFERTPALALERNGQCWRVATPDGCVLADRVVLANNAFSKGLGIGGERIVAMYTYAALTEKLPAGTLPGSESEWGLLPTHRLGSTLRRTADNRLLIRSQYGYEREVTGNAIDTQLRTALQRRFPSVAATPFAAVWSGATGFTWNGAPLWGELADGLFVSVGCNGGGVVKGTLFGRALAELACGIDAPDIPGLFGQASWMPPEPFRHSGFRIIAGIERLRGRAEV